MNILARNTDYLMLSGTTFVENHENEKVKWSYSCSKFDSRLIFIYTKSGQQKRWFSFFFFLKVKNGRTALTAAVVGEMHCGIPGLFPATRCI